MRTVLLEGAGAVGVAAYRRLRAEGAAVTVVAPPSDYLADVARSDGTLALSPPDRAAFNETLAADGPWPAG